MKKSVKKSVFFSLLVQILLVFLIQWFFYTSICLQFVGIYNGVISYSIFNNIFPKTTNVFCFLSEQFVNNKQMFEFWLCRIKNGHHLDFFLIQNWTVSCNWFVAMCAWKPSIERPMQELIFWPTPLIVWYLIISF